MPSSRNLRAVRRGENIQLAPDSYKALCGICKDYSTCENRRSVKKVEATAAAGSAYAFGYLGFSVRSRSFHVDISHPPAQSDANLSDKTANGPLANPLEGKTVPRVKRRVEPPGRGGGKREQWKGTERTKREVVERVRERALDATGEISGGAIDWRAGDANAQPTSTSLD